MPQSHSEVSYQIVFEPSGNRVDITGEDSLLAAAQAAGVGLISLCGGVGACESCKVQLIQGELTPLSATEEAELYPQEIESGYRLACQAYPRSDVKVYLPPESLTASQRLQLEGREVGLDLDPVVRAVDLELEPPTMSDLRPDVSRLRDALDALGISGVTMGLSVMATLSDRLREFQWKPRLAMRSGEVVGVYPKGTQLLGLAMDIGTTKLAVYLVDLTTGKTIARAGAMNPQIAHGEDVLSRIAYAVNHPEGRERLQSVLVDKLNQLIAGLCQDAGVSRETIVEAVAVGNTAMHHLLLGLPVEQLGLAPYVPVVSDPVEITAREIGLEIAPGAYLYLPSNIAGFVGADHVAMLLATEVWNIQRGVIALDIGTNTEITLAVNGRLMSCSAASGPAFEGAHIRHGMRAAAGAIERVWIEGDKVCLQTIANQLPVGICGSGILDAVAQMHATGIVNRRGQFAQDHPRVRRNHGQWEFLLSPAESNGHRRDIVVTREDIQEIQLAKAAIRSGIEVLLDRAGITAEDIEEIIVAGAFGTYIDVKSAVRIGMFPDVPLHRICQVGNAAGMGAKQLLVSRQRRNLAEEIIERIVHVELTVADHFSDLFVKHMYF
jgi:uncharacterized 2Fe-2S/4Fe-4S cluster protein (DUF4445 family)